MQIDDGVMRQVGKSLFDDTINHRNFTGEGEMDVVEIIRIVAGKGNLRHVGPKVFSLEADARSAREAGVKSAETSRKVLAEAGVAVPA